MSLINLRERTINAKIVYYGTALSGKTTSLKRVHTVVDPEQHIELVSLNTEGDRTLFFDFLPIPLGTLNGIQVKLQAFTVPGQVKYNLTRRYVLRGADAVVFVADSGPDVFKDNEHSLETLWENLKANGLDRDKVNVNGGAISLGHPLGATGTRLVLTLMYELRRSGKRYGMASACIGGGQGIAILVENPQAS